MEFITQGIGTPSDITSFVLLGLTPNPGAGPQVTTSEVTFDGVSFAASVVASGVSVEGSEE